MKRILATTAIVALTAMPAVAQAETTDQTSPSVTESSGVSSDHSATKANTDSSADAGVMPQLTDEERTALTAEDLEGVALFDATDERVGEISDIVLTDDGQVEQVIVDVGGFLGLGEKPVAVAFEEIEISRDQAGDTDALEATTSLTIEEFEAMKEWKG
jgi:sporulation protein YlmC with PRC-barrel domain